MGVDIVVLKPVKRVEWDYDNSWYICPFEHTSNKHLTMFKPGRYVCDNVKDVDFHTTYDSFRRLKIAICKIVNNVEIDYLRNHANRYVDSPFFEFLMFGLEGSFDYKTALKLRKDFKQYQEVARKAMSWYTFYLYNSYLGVLRSAIKNEAVVLYC